ncbi:MAG: PEP-CTERM sorting domain-containing protein [Bryobacteraceae bacterium]|nr:PEP-CTERM sorting domain-containing protein [Bryobacteraceae bacterium]
MKSTLLVALAASAMAVQAAPFFYTFYDPYGGPNPGAAGNNGDVIGALRRFDIEKVAITGDGGQVHIAVFMNYGQEGGDTSLGGINVGYGFPVLHPGDLMFTSGASHWAISLIDHGGLTAGNLFEVTGFLKAYEVLGNPPGNFRPNADVWGDGNGANKTGDGALTTAATTGSQIRVDVELTTSNAAFLHALSTGDFELMFAAATCGNDIVTGEGGSEVPEPMTSLLIGAGLAGLGLLRRRT